MSREVSKTTETSYCYDLSPLEVSMLSSDIANKLTHQMHLPEGIYSTWLDPNCKYSNIARTSEMEHWPYMEEIMRDHEQQSKFLMLFDTREDTNQPVHFTRISTISDKAMEDGALKTGLIIIDDIIDSNQGLNATNFKDYYKDLDVDLRKCITVETNIKRREVPVYNGLNTADLAYLSMFKYVKEGGADVGKAYVFAVINMPTIKSFGRIGLEYESLGGIPDLRTPSTPGSFDDNFIPVAIPYSRNNYDLFSAIEDFGADQIAL